MADTYRRAMRRQEKMGARLDNFSQPLYGGTLTGKAPPALTAYGPPAIGSNYGGNLRPIEPPYALEPPPSAVFYDESNFVQPVQDVVPAYPDLFEVLPDGTVLNRAY